MSPRLNALLERLVRLLRKRGSKKHLALLMGVPPPRLSEWLTGKHEPSAETTLRLLEWVQAEEAKQKSPASVRAPAEQRTRLRKRDEAKPKPSPPS